MESRFSAAERLDSELAAVLDSAPKGADGKLLDLSDIPGQRALLAEAAKADPRDEEVGLEVLGVERADGSSIELRLHRPATGRAHSPALLWCHAGGQVFGSAADDDGYASRLAATVGCVVVAVDYRLAPETPAPGGAEDAAEAWAYLVAHADDLRVDPERVGLAGASGGGAIAAAAALMIRDRGGDQPRLLSLLGPMLDDRNETRSSREVTDVGIWDRSQNLAAWTAVLGDRLATPDLDPYSAPGRANNLHGLPPTFIAVGEVEVFRDESVDLARRLLEAHVPVDLHVYAGAFHAWNRFAPDSFLARTADRTWHDWLRHRLAE